VRQSTVSSCGGRQRRRELCCPASVAGAPGRNSVQKVHGVKALLMAWTDGIEAARWWLLVVSRAARVSAEAKRRASARGETGGGFSTARPRVKSRLISPRGRVRDRVPVDAVRKRMGR
jgi:hypothetical protein